MSNAAAQNPESVDVAVIGAGPAGSAVAAALSDRGWSVALIERDRLPRHKVCGEFLSPEAQATLADLGLYAELAALRPVELTTASLTSRRGRTLQTPLPGSAWGLSRHAMDAALAHGAAGRGALVWESTVALALETRQVHGAERYHLTLRRGRESGVLRARAVIMAAGRSLSPNLATRVEARPRARLNVGVKGHFAGIRMPAQVRLYLFEGGYVGVNPVETGAVNVCLLASYSAFAAAGGTATRMFASITRQNQGFADLLDGAALIDDTVCTVAAVDTGRPNRPWNGVACVGDSATMIPPLCGDGMAMALHSAALCVPHAHAYLQGRIDLAGWRTGYTRDWHAAFSNRLRTGRALQAILNSPLADGALAAGRFLPPAADYLVRATRGPLPAP